MKNKHPWTTYLKRAFKNVYNIGALVLIGGLSLIFIDGAGPGIAMLGGAAEIIYLYMMASNPRFMRHVDSLIAAEDELDIDSYKEAMWPMIGSKLRQHYEELAESAGRLEDEDISMMRRRDPFFKENKRKVRVLLANYLRIAVALTRYETYLTDIDPEEINLNIERLEEEVLGSSERVQQVKMKNIDILKKRLDKVDKARTNSEYLGAQMETIEDTMSLVVDQAITLSDPKGMGMQIDNLLANLQETELIAAEMESFSELSQGFDDDFMREEELE